MGRWYLGQLASGATLEDATFLDVEIPGDADGSGGGLLVCRHPGLEHYPRLIEAARSRLADLELDYGVEKSKVDSVRSRLFGALRPYYQERDRLRLLIQYRLDHTLMELRSLYEHLQARILELIEAYLGHPRFKNLGTANLANQANEESKDESSESFHSSS